MPTYVVYVDEVFVENLVMDFALLYTAARLCRIGFRPWRLFAAAVLGGLYTVGLFFPAARPLMGPGGKFLASVAMIAAAFAPLAARRFLLALASLYLAAFAAVGAALTAAFFLAGAGHPWEVDVVLAGRIAPAVAAALPVLWLLGRLVRRGAHRLALDACRMRLLIHLQGRRVQVDALVDTGNRLEDPLSGHPVVVVESEALSSLLPEGLALALAGRGEVDFAAVAESAGRDLACRLRLIPFRAVGRSGLMVGFRPDHLEIVGPVRARPVREVVVGITRERFDPALNCRALVNPRLLEDGPA